MGKHRIRGSECYIGTDPAVQHEEGEFGPVGFLFALLKNGTLVLL